MADGNSNHKRSDISSTSVKSSDNKRQRIDLNSSLQDITGMDIENESEMDIDIEIDAIVDKALGSVTLSNSVAKHAGAKQRRATMNNDELFAKLLSGVATATSGDNEGC